jgi:hypothetical protein
VGDPPFALEIAVIDVDPVTVTLENILLFTLLKEVTGSVPLLSAKNSTEPPAPVFEKPVTMALPLTSLSPEAGSVTSFKMNVTVPVVFTEILLNRLLEIEMFNAGCTLEIKLITAVPATVCPKFENSVELILNVEVADADVPSITIPLIIPEAPPCFTDNVLELIEFVKVPVGVEEYAAM